ncbi:hypothetical protein GCM10009678_45940 [Actinomadura kijaniata]|uniref:Uncharacterized protein n=1 Tax=Actinomadura namibiensis TaxID=182080 RepID=A0A7W3LXE3_ACTNM|nr:hypothetical protein [Actinomadura namibiensis]MBA8955950.1 hypothetical protein [Actinomadura namibiensis]
MAWQLHYTSARRGPTGRAGFQFVAETPGLPDGVRARVTPYLSYRPPPDAPLSPDAAELERFPVALLYDVVEGRPLLLRCRYLGRDYSGRYGNFFAHAVVADPDELEGLRPAELWEAPLWAEEPSGDPDLPALEDLVPDAGVAPDALAGWLAGVPHAHALLARLVDAVTDVLDRGHGRVVLVARDVADVARWIAVLSYSLPVAATARMSFVTYSADPEGAGQRLVGTTPDVWAAARRPAGHAFVLDGPVPGGEPSRFARMVAAFWREADLPGLDALAELATLEPAALDRAAALLALCRGETGIPPDEEAAAAALLARHGTAIPDWVWRDLVPGVPSMGFDLAVAVHDRARAADAADVAAQCAARATALALTTRSPSARASAPRTPGGAQGAARPADACAGSSAGLPAPGDVLARLPRCALPAGVGVEVAAVVGAALGAASGVAEVAWIVAVADRVGVPVDPAEVTAAVAARVRGADVVAALEVCPDAMRGAVVDGVLRGLGEAGEETRRGVLTDDVCDVLYGDPEPLCAVPLVALAVLGSVGRRYRERRVAVTGRMLGLRVFPSDLDPVLREVWAVPPSPGECLELMEDHVDRFRGHPALAVLPSRAFTRLAVPEGERLTGADALRLAERVRALLPDGTAARDADVVRACAALARAEAPEDAARALGAIAFTAGASRRLRDEAFAGAARRLARRDPGFRAEVLAAASERVRTRLAERWAAGPPDRAGRVELLEVVLRLRGHGVADAALDAWARAAVGRRFGGRRLEHRFSGDPGLRAALRDLMDGR